VEVFIMTVLTDAPPVAVGATPDEPEPASLPLERVEAEICTLAGQIAAATSRFLTLLADFDDRDGWAGTGIYSCAQWLSWRCGLDLRTAQEHVRVARALRVLPRTREAFAHGRVSYSKVRSVSRVATPDNEEDLVQAALDSPAAQLDRLVRGIRRAQRNQEEEAAAKAKRAAGASGDEAGAVRAGVQWRWEDDGSLRIWGRLRAEDGARLLAGLTRLDQEHRRTEDTGDKSHGATPATEPGRVCGERRSAERRSPQVGVAGTPPRDLAPALAAAGDLMCTEVQVPMFAPAADVLVHVDIDTLVRSGMAGKPACAEPVPKKPLDPAVGGEGTRLDDGPALTAATLQLLACDGRMQLSVCAADGRVLNLGRRRRRPTRAQLAVLWRRDRGCAHPGCGRTRFLHAHHVVPWAVGGRTDLDNLILLCGEHHRALHDGAFGIVALGKQRFRFHGPRGAERGQAPAMRGNAARLAAAHPEITPRTIQPDWDGTPLDLPHATDILLTNWAIQAARRTAAAAAMS
jgi:hypothetical protein